MVISNCKLRNKIKFKIGTPAAHKLYNQTTTKQNLNFQIIRSGYYPASIMITIIKIIACIKLILSNFNSFNSFCISFIIAHHQQYHHHHDHPESRQ